MKDEILNEEFMEIPQPKSHKKIKIAIAFIASLDIIATTTLLIEYFKFDWFKSEVYDIDAKISNSLYQANDFTEKKTIKSKSGIANGISETIKLSACTTYQYLDYDYNTKKFIIKTCSNPNSITGSERY